MSWYPWGSEAFAEAARRDVPVLVSIGYSTCHWCHVMARESFEDEATAALIDEGFVAVKVDREEHPDVDAAYLEAASAFTPHLGWPLTAFATPEGRVFYAGTYWPREPRPPLPAFRDVLAAVREAWTQRRAEVESTGERLREALAAAGRETVAERLPTLERLAEAARSLVAREDIDHGGFAAGGGIDTPKFPTVPALRFLQSHALAGVVPEAAAVAGRALAAMAASELHDTVDGGFFRYATRRDWSVPHFERMLTDNAGLVEVALDAGDVATVRDAARFMIEVLQQPTGGFAAAQDSESIVDGERSEGGYYAHDAAGRASLDAPAIDGKVVTGWNGLAIAALARAGFELDEPEYLEAARWAAEAVLEANVDREGMLRRSSFDEIASPAAATLEDYGGLARGLVALAIATGEAAYARMARELVDTCLTEDDAVRVPGGGDPVLVTQGVGASGAQADGASPSPRAAFASAALALWRLGAGERYREAAASLVRGGIEIALEQPLAHGALLEAAVALAAPPRQVVVVLDDARPGPASVRSIRAEVVAIVSDREAEAFAEAGFTLFEGKTSLEGSPTLYDCRDFVCRLPVILPR